MKGALIIVGGALFSGLALYGFFTDESMKVRLASVRPSKPEPKEGGLSNQGDTPTAFFITMHGSATGYHFTDKLTPDGLLCGFQHNDFAPGFVQSYAVKLPSEMAAHIFAEVSSDTFQSLPDHIQDPRIHDGFVLKITARIARSEKVIWLSNVSHPLLSPLVEKLWQSAPGEHRRELPSFPPAA